MSEPKYKLDCIYKVDHCISVAVFAVVVAAMAPLDLAAFLITVSTGIIGGHYFLVACQELDQLHHKGPAIAESDSLLYYFCKSEEEISSFGSEEPVGQTLSDDTDCQ
jgi:hypothetical protein